MSFFYIKLITLISIIVWTLAAVRQSGSKYFYFFFFLAIMDPVGFIYVKLFHSFNIFLFAVFHFLEYSALLNHDKKKKFQILIILIPSLIIIQHIVFNNLFIDQILYGLAILIVFVKILELIIISAYYKKNLSLFFVVLLLYQLTVFVKFISYFTIQPQNIIYFWITTAFEIMIGLYFCFFRENQFKIPLRFE